jgi:Na+-transporting methylmalonyl-CoA/oxaloacetate decarboxylase gamma subunit
MEIDWTWAQAWEIGGIGFGMVFAVLIILALTIWLIGLIIRRIEGRSNKAETGNEKTSSTK